jgi:hypothetical protein
MPGPDYLLLRRYFLLYNEIAIIPKQQMVVREPIMSRPRRRIPLFFHLKWSTKAIDTTPWPAQQPSITLDLRMERLNDLLDIVCLASMAWPCFIFLFFFSILLSQ